MTADVATSLKDWSATAASNQPDNSDAVGPNTLAENIRTLQSVVRAAVAGGDTVASATTTDIGAKDANYLAVSGTTTITGLGTVSAGIIKVLKFDGALTFTHNATSLILFGANITTAAGDIAVMRSEGSGNWRCLVYMPRAGLAKSGANTDITSLSNLTSVGAVTTIDINGGTIDGTTIGGASPAAVTGTNITATGSLFANGASSSIGFTTGAGGTVTQATSKSTAVTLNKATGEITMNNAALGAGASVTFTCNNSLALNQLCIADISSAFGVAYRVKACTDNGAIYFTVTNETAGSLSDAVVIKFALFSRVTS